MDYQDPTWLGQPSTQLVVPVLMRYARLDYLVVCGARLLTKVSEMAVKIVSKIHINYVLLSVLYLNFLIFCEVDKLCK